MTLDFCRDRWDRVKAVHRQWWSGELDRPLFLLTSEGRDPGRAEPALCERGFTSHYGLDPSAEAIVDRWDYWLSGQFYLGDGFPSIWPNFGPGVAAAFLGCQIKNNEHSSWFIPRESLPIRDRHLRYDPNNVWLRRVKDLMRVGCERWQGQVQIGMTDLGGNLDILASFRPGEELLLDLTDEPDEVKRLTWEAHTLWWLYYDEVQRAGGGVNPGWSAWTPIFSETPYYMLQCDFAYMLGPRMFDEFVKPELAVTCRRLDHAFYHLDGIGQLAHLDSLLSIPELKGVQWIPGDGQPGVTHWPEVYRKIRKAGKLVQVFTGQDQSGFRLLDTLVEQVGSAEGIVLIGAVKPSERGDAEAMMRRYGWRE